MNLIRLTESCSFDNKLFAQIPAASLKESILSAKKLSEATKKSILKEGAGCTNAWRIPISVYGKKNGNGRIYPKKLWEHVIKDQGESMKGTPALFDHPAEDSDGTPANICGVWMGLEMDPPNEQGEGFVWGYLIPSGHLGADLQDHLEHGLKVGTSSSGFGQLMDDGVTVDPDCYVLERPADIVLTPSQSTFFKKDEDGNIINASASIDSEENEETTSQKESDSYDDHFSYYDNEDDDIYEKKEDAAKSQCKNVRSTKERLAVSSVKISKLEEKRFRKDMESFLKEAEAIEDPQAKLNEFQEIESYLEDGACPDLREQIEAKIAAQKKYISEALKDKLEMEKTLDVKNTQDLKEKLTRISEDTAVIQAEAQDWKTVAEKLQNKLSETQKELAARHTDSYVSFLKKRLERTYAEKRADKNTINNLKEQLSQKDQMTKTLQNTLQNTQNQLEEQLSQATQLALEQRKMFESKAFEYKNTAKLNEKSIAASYKAQIDKLQNQLNEALSLISRYQKATQKQNEKIFHQESQIKENKVRLMKAGKKLDEVKKLSADQLQKIYEKARKNEMAPVFEKNIDQEIADSVPMNESLGVRHYYEQLKGQYGNLVVPFKEQILSRKTVDDAKTQFLTKILPEMNYTPSIED
jgi:hypothetical protein